MKHISETVISVAEKTAPCDPRVAELLSYLEYNLPGYPFNPDVDVPFAEELAADFPTVDLLEETKTLRWYYDNEPLAGAKKPRVKLRRWVANAARPHSPW